MQGPNREVYCRLPRDADHLADLEVFRLGLCEMGAVGLGELAHCLEGREVADVVAERGGVVQDPRLLGIPVVYTQSLDAVLRPAG